MVLMLAAVWLRHRHKTTAKMLLTGVAGLMLVALASAMVLSEWCPWSREIVEKKQFYANFVGGVFMLFYGLGLLRGCFTPRTDGHDEPPETMAHAHDPGAGH